MWKTNNKAGKAASRLIIIYEHKLQNIQRTANNVNLWQCANKSCYRGGAVDLQGQSLGGT